MTRARKLQVFVSSTYSDLTIERQAAVEAILTAGHIPAGMELFAAGDESQLQVITRWIDESDVFLLILGGRYGSTDPKSGKSYIQLEYEHALAQGKPLFAVVITPAHLEEKVRLQGSSVIETENAAKLRTFGDDVRSRIVRFWADPRDIKLAVLETLSEISRRVDVGGWIRTEDAANVAGIADEIARLSKENATLRDQLTRVASASRTFNGLEFDELYDLLAQRMPPPTSTFVDASISSIAKVFGDNQPGLLHSLWLITGYLATKASLPNETLAIVRDLAEFGLVERVIDARSNRIYGFTEAGKEFVLRVRTHRDVAEADQYRI